MSEMQGSHTYTNRLIHETSPYLLQHAHNPVDWYPWGEEALRKAASEDKPILLSVGYSACHWCHVMERESFENEKIAAIMNQHFVSIKVDREERPDIDGIYMQAVQALTRQGGWPMTVFLTPDGRPFYGGTYFPPNDRHYGQQMMAGFPRVLLSVSNAYSEHRSEVEDQATQLAEHLRNAGLPRRPQAQTGTLPLETLNLASQELLSDIDRIYGGFGNAPKFPNTMALELLLQVHLHRQQGELQTEGDAHEAAELSAVELSLQRMANGGIYDQLGGGFHRYSVDTQWLVPHFEKMLYDNALLSRLYLHAYLLTGKAFYERVAVETLDYVVREMLSPEGGFYSTQDADSEGEEGRFFVWTREEIEQHLPTHDAALFIPYYGVSEGGNFEGKNILYVPGSAQKVADNAQISVEELQASLQRSRELLFRERERRVKPGRDEKILTSWNGLMLRSFAEAARYLNRPDYLEVARKNADFLLTRLRNNGRLLRTYKDGRARLNGYLEDYAYLAEGLLSLYEASFETRWFSEARALMDQAIALFGDDEHGGFYDTGTDHEQLVSRPRELMDNATPAGNSVAASALLRLAALTGEESYRQRAEAYLLPLVDLMKQHPQFFGYALSALDMLLSSVKEIAISGDPHSADTRALLEVVDARYLPNSVLACSQPTQANEIPLLVERPMLGNKATAYVCQNFTCQAPVTMPEALAALL